MKLNGIAHRSVEADPAAGCVRILDQTLLPWRTLWLELATLEDTLHAIATMQVRGAPLIGAVAAWGVALALRADASDAALERDAARLVATRPTAVNLRWAVERMGRVLRPLPPAARAAAAAAEAARIAEEDAAQCAAIGQAGAELIADLARRSGSRRSDGRVNVLTHCNAGWLATVDWGTALAPIYAAAAAGIDVHVWVDETRPRNQGASLTAFELAQQGIAHTVVADNAGGHLMQHGQVDIVIVGADRVTRRGDVANKIGTYLKALAAHDNAVPFWVAVPSSTIDWTLADGVAEIPIEERAGREVTHISGRDAGGEVREVQLTASPAANPAFDVTPARLVRGLITERGRCPATEAGLAALFGR